LGGDGLPELDDGLGRITAATTPTPGGSAATAAVLLLAEPIHYYFQRVECYLIVLENAVLHSGADWNKIKLNVIPYPVARGPKAEQDAMYYQGHRNWGDIVYQGMCPDIFIPGRSCALRCLRCRVGIQHSTSKTELSGDLPF
jgi:hypothetical protein